MRSIGNKLKPDPNTLCGLWAPEASLWTRPLTHGRFWYPVECNWVDTPTCSADYDIKWQLTESWLLHSPRIMRSRAKQLNPDSFTVCGLWDPVASNWALTLLLFTDFFDLSASEILVFNWAFLIMLLSGDSTMIQRESSQNPWHVSLPPICLNLQTVTAQWQNEIILSEIETLFYFKCFAFWSFQIPQRR